MTIELSQRINRVKPSITLAITAKAKLLKSHPTDLRHLYSLDLGVDVHHGGASLPWPLHTAGHVIPLGGAREGNSVRCTTVNSILL